MRRVSIVVLLICVGLSSANSQESTKQSKSPSVLKARIPAAKPRLYRAIRDGTNWRNPFLIVNEDGVQIRKSGDDYEAPIVPVSEVLGVLEVLPTSAWPYGLIVAVEENGLCCAHSDGRAKKHANWVELLGRLKQAGIVVSLWPSARDPLGSSTFRV